MKSYSSREILQAMSEDGWVLKEVNGDHYQFVHPTKPGKVTVKHPCKGLSSWLIHQIKRQAGLKLD